MGNSPSTDLGGAELHGRVVEAVESEGEKSPGFTELANTNSKSKDDESLNSKPLQWRPTAGLGEDRVSGSERVRPDDAEGSRTERNMERTRCPEVSSMGNGETKSTSTVRRIGLWDEDEATGRSNGRGEGRRSSEIEGVNPLGSDARKSDGRQSPGFDSSQGRNSQYHTAVTERVETRRTPSCPKDRWSNSATKGTKSSDDEMNEADAKADSIRHPPSSSRRSSQRTKTKERKTLFATSDSEGETSVYESVRVRTRKKKDRSTSRSNSRGNRSISRERGKTRGSANNSPKNGARSSPKNKARNSPKNGAKNSTKKQRVIQDLTSDSSSDEERENKSPITKPRHILKPPKFDGLSLFESFWAQFKNCSEHNQWNQTEKLVYLKSSLDKEVANVLWDYGEEATGLILFRINQDTKGKVRRKALL